MVRRLGFSFFALLFALSVRADVVDIDNAELARLNAAGVPVIDIRTEGEWKETGIVAGSKLLTFVDERGRTDSPAWLEKVHGVARPDQPVILICRSGNRTKAASRVLSQEAGYRKVYSVQGGILAWAKEGRPMAPAPSALVTCAAGAHC